MASARLDAADRIEDESIAEPVEQRANVGCGRLRAGAGEFDLLGRQGLDREDGEDHVLDAEAGIVPEIDRVELRGEQPGEVARVAARPGGADMDMLDSALHSGKAEHEPARAPPP